MSDQLVDISALADGMKEYSDAQYRTLVVLQKENHQLKEEITHLKELLAASSPLISSPTVKIDLPPEQIICEIQINMLQDKAKDRELTLEETKRMEILIKSLYLIKERAQAEIKASFMTLPDAATIENLSKIAATPDAPVENE